jgi:hypothetical protein
MESRSGDPSSAAAAPLVGGRVAGDGELCELSPGSLLESLEAADLHPVVQRIGVARGVCERVLRGPGNLDDVPARRAQGRCSRRSDQEDPVPTSRVLRATMRQEAGRHAGFREVFRDGWEPHTRGNLSNPLMLRAEWRTFEVYLLMLRNADTDVTTIRKFYLAPEKWNRSEPRRAPGSSSPAARHPYTCASTARNPTRAIRVDTEGARRGRTSRLQPASGNVDCAREAYRRAARTRGSREPDQISGPCPVHPNGEERSSSPSPWRQRPGRTT